MYLDKSSLLATEKVHGSLPPLTFEKSVHNLLTTPKQTLCIYSGGNSANNLAVPINSSPVKAGETRESS